MTLYLTALGASLLGSLHCVGMCGGFAVAVSGAHRRLSWSLLCYHLSRGAGYLLLGALAGFFGAELDEVGALVGAQNLAGPLMGLTLIAIGLISLWRQHQRNASDPSLVELKGPPRGAMAKLRAFPLFRGAASLLANLQLRTAGAIRRGGLIGAVAAGFLTGLLPCGWLWSYVLAASGTGDALTGAGVMLAFWLGTIPALSLVGVLAGGIGSRIGRKAPLLVALSLIALGLVSLTGKLDLAPSTLDGASDKPSCHAES